ncbi:hypothetical protein ACFFGH_10770 [Lysobacter korlensis]|uniref:Uncharacterized protein n=1 Tax=Lysobacter korlensis TaxID=553636 RepID=A0ABV6RMW4_9GAMM
MTADFWDESRPVMPQRHPAKHRNPLVAKDFGCVPADLRKRCPGELLTSSLLDRCLGSRDRGVVAFTTDSADFLFE